MLRRVTRVYAYLYFLTDDYPPFSLPQRGPDSLVVDVPPPVRLNPLAVLFRIILVIPAWIVMAVALYGLGVVSIASWAMILFTGKLPDRAVRVDACGDPLLHEGRRVFLDADAGVPLGALRRRSPLTVSAAPKLLRGCGGRGPSASHPKGGPP